MLRSNAVVPLRSASPPIIPKEEDHLIDPEPPLSSPTSPPLPGAAGNNTEDSAEEGSPPNSPLDDDSDGDGPEESL